MSQAVPQQHPAVVLRSHYIHLRTLLAIAMIALVGLAAAVIVLATDDGSAPARTAAPSSSTAPSTATQSVGTTRYDGGPDEGTRGTGQSVAPVSHYNGPH